LSPNSAAWCCQLAAIKAMMMPRRVALNSRSPAAARQISPPRFAPYHPLRTARIGSTLKLRGTSRPAKARGLVKPILLMQLHGLLQRL
jgi:hypothetical protein